MTYTMGDGERAMIVTLDRGMEYSAEMIEYNIRVIVRSLLRFKDAREWNAFQILAYRTTTALRVESFPTPEVMARGRVTRDQLMTMVERYNA